ncbi:MULTISPECIES: DNA topoisomerase III [unclassified Pseudomonas]|uniref:DNA topoisomerase III n=1 Tax=unclassified Pseudomonas TaxID=196821 RepID=UPI002B2308CF|nr:MULTISPECIES: DNA topoisomerase III [unclassified Pseudomonas]MEA9976529.1 DNA topoisomerase III [Pseudomonas sp. RTS4]MEB0199376.1 DNA topoisomerase III [Pseudomonas sp. 5S4]MEB0244082.1 DNA topoisomerase III [Pseudomonas sp. 10S5]
MRLFLCEKPSQGKDIARVLGATKRGDGYLIGDSVCVTWCIGHLLETAAPEAYDARYKSWSLDHLPIIPSDWRVQVKPRTAAQFKAVKKLLGEARELVIATDADREGELIAREIIDYCGYRGPVQRLWLSALNPESIRKALADLKPGEETFLLYHAALARSRADWLIGMNLSRLFTLIARRGGHDQLFTVGRVQTPTLSLVVNRDRAISAFVKKPFWEVEVLLSAQGQAFSAKWKAPRDLLDSEGRCVDQAQALQASRRIAQGQAVVSNIDVERITERPPLPFDLATLQELCDRQLGMGVEETLNIAQSLYETHKATHYPRTECAYLPESMLEEVPAVLAALGKTDPSIIPLLQKINAQQRSHCWDDKKLVGPHHGIIPTTEPADISRMSDKESKVYDLIRRRYIAQFLSNHEYDRASVSLLCSDMELRAVGKQIAVTGWKTLFSGNASSDGTDEETITEKTQQLPVLHVGQSCRVDAAELKSLMTSPPRPYTEGSLLKAMKNIAEQVADPRLKAKLKATTGIGTQATRASIIKGLMQRGYIEKKRRTLSPTASAFALIDAIPAIVKDPGMTAIWEQASDEIEAGRMTLDSFLNSQGLWIGKLVEQCSTVTLRLDQPPTPPCRQCGSSMIKRKGKKGLFLSCTHYPDCKGVLSIGPTSKRSVNPKSYK